MQKDADEEEVMTVMENVLHEEETVLQEEDSLPEVGEDKSEVTGLEVRPQGHTGPEGENEGETKPEVEAGGQIESSEVKPGGEGRLLDSALLIEEEEEREDAIEVIQVKYFMFKERVAQKCAFQKINEKEKIG